MKITPEVINIDEWESDFIQDKKNDIYIGSKEILFSPFQSGDIVNNTEQWIEKNASKEFWSARSYALHLFWWIIGCVAFDNDIDSKIASRDYARRALRRLKKNKDSGLLPTDAITTWSTFTEEEKKYISSLVLESAKHMESFPTLASMNVIATHEHASVRFGNYDFDMYIPVILETKSGIAGIAPIISKYDLPTADILTQQNHTYDIILDSVHIWNLEDNKRVKATGEYIGNAESIVSCLRYAE